MRNKRDYSFGVIPLYRTERGWQVLVIHQYGSKGDAYWGFPKGHRERGERNLDAARRELKEETGLSARIDTRREFIQRYIFTHGDTTIHKKVTYYVGYVKDKRLALEAKELKDAKWCSFRSARDLLSHEVTRQMFDEVIAHVTEKE
jgi:tRNA nucleotidyltransferase (CCA-adding enzyme)